MRAAYQKGGYPDARWQIELVPGRFACEPECSGVCARDKDADGAYAESKQKPCFHCCNHGASCRRCLDAVIKTLSQVKFRETVSVKLNSFKWLRRRGIRSLHGIRPKRGSDATGCLFHRKKWELLQRTLLA